MGSVKIVVDVPDGHSASIYALILSIIKNKYEESVYHIYLAIREKASSQQEELIALQTDTVSIIPVSAEIQLSDIKNAIRLQWNMLVTGDLTELFKQNFVDSGDELCGDSPFNNGAVILQSNITYNPEEYFDHPHAGQWLKYYKVSPMNHVPLRRCSYIETLGEISIKDSESAVPIAICTCDGDIPSTIALLYSIRKNTLASTQLDIRIFYRNLSQAHINEVLSLRDDYTSIILYNVKRCTDTDNSMTKIVPALMAFDEYDTIIYMDSKCLCLGDIVSLYRHEIEPYDVRVVGTVPETGELPKMMLLNTVSWIQNDISSRYIILSRVYERFMDLVYMAGVKRVDCMKSFAMHAFLEEDNPWIYSDKTVVQLLWNYLFMSPHFEQLKSEALAYDQQREVAKMQEVLKQLKDLEIENNRLAQEVRSLEEDNTSLRTERDRFLFELLETRKSLTYRIGRAITFLPRRIRGERKSTD